MGEVAFIPGITGQDRSYLAPLLLSNDYKACGLVRRSSTINFEPLALAAKRYGDLIHTIFA